jgi:FkbM family methyltransferase
MTLKHLIRNLLNFLHLDLTKNLQYDRLTKLILEKHLKANSNCIDVGCHKGEILDLILKSAPNGKHFGFEPIPVLYNDLVMKYKGLAKIFPYALADEAGKAKFNYVKNAPAYSGLKQRNYDGNEPIIEQIDVEIMRLDEVIPNDTVIDLIKIDVEGAEFGVLKGALAILKKDHPLLVFESGKGASDFYGTQPEALYNYLVKENAYQLYTLPNFLNQKAALTVEQFTDCFETNKEYYFVGA